MFSLVYVSKSLLERGQAVREIGAIVDVSTVRNAAAGVTGALLYTGTRFAQVLEGDEPAVREIMASIVRDPRHCDVIMVDEDLIAARRFSTWSLVYPGHSTFAATTVERALAERERGDGYALNNLIRLLQELARSI